MTKKKFIETDLDGARGRDPVFAKRYLRIDRSDIAYLRFTLEAHDGLGFIRTVDNTAAIVEFCYPPSQERLATDFLHALQGECRWSAVAKPEDVEPL